MSVAPGLVRSVPARSPSTLASATFGYHRPGAFRATFVSSTDMPAPSSRRPNKSALAGTDHPPRDAVAQYLDDIGRYPRLNRQQEQALARAVQLGMDATAQLNDAKAAARLTKRQVAELSRTSAAGEEAWQQLVNCNLRLVVSICKDFTRHQFSLLDLVSVGNEGLMVACRKFNPEMGVPLGNYAAYWVKQRVLKWIAENGFSVRVPPYRAALVNKVVRVHTRLSTMLERSATTGEVAAALQTGDAESGKAPISLAEVDEVLRMMQPAMELDAPLSEDGDTASYSAYFGESVADAEARTEALLRRIELREAVSQALTTLSEREAKVLVWLFGLQGTHAIELDEIAKRLGVTRERARQIKASALERLAECGVLQQCLAH